MNGVNRLATKGEKILLTTDKTRKKLLTSDRKKTEIYRQPTKVENFNRQPTCGPPPPPPPPRRPSIYYCTIQIEKVSITVSCCVLRYDFRVQKKMQDDKTAKIRISRNTGCETLTFTV